jgi:hypothetical protein
MEMLDMLDIEYDPNDAISVYDAQQMFNSSPRVHGVSLSTATQLFFTFRIPIDEFIGQDGDACYATLQRLIATRKVEAAEGIAAAAEEAYEAPARPPQAPRSSAAPAPKPPVPNGCAPLAACAVTSLTCAHPPRHAGGAPRGAAEPFLRVPAGVQRQRQVLHRHDRRR